MLRAIHACEDREAAPDTANAVIQQLTGLRLKEAAQRVRDSIAGTPTFYGFPTSPWRHIQPDIPQRRRAHQVR